MNHDMHFIWQEVVADISTPVALWQLGIIAIACAIAWAINGLLRAKVMRTAPDAWKRAIGGINRVLFPLSTLVLVQLAKFVLGYWQHTSMLELASTLLLANGGDTVGCLWSKVYRRARRAS